MARRHVGRRGEVGARRVGRRVRRAGNRVAVFLVEPVFEATIGDRASACRIDVPGQGDARGFHIRRFPGGDDRPNVAEDRDLAAAGF